MLPLFVIYLGNGMNHGNAATWL